MIKTFVKKPVKVQAIQWTNDEYIIIDTPEGDHCLRNGDWVIRGVNGEIYSCDPDIFKKTYEEVNMVFMTMSTWDNGSGCFYYTKEEFLKEISAMIDDCIANGGTHFDAEITTDASCYLIEESKEGE